jgi:hypothetical protein
MQKLGLGVILLGVFHIQALSQVSTTLGPRTKGIKHVYSTEIIGKDEDGISTIVDCSGRANLAVSKTKTKFLLL